MDIREAIIYKNIFGGGDGSNAMIEHKLTYNGTAIQLDGATQTFAQVKSACDDATKFVFLVYENRLYIPQYVTASAIYFTCTYPTNTSGVMTRRIAMTSNNTVTVNNTELQPKLTAGENISIVDNVISATGGGGGGGMVVNFTYTYDEETDTDSITSDKTQDEIIEAMQAGIVVSGKIILDDIVVPVGYAILDFRNGAENRCVAFGFIASREDNNAYVAYHDNESDSWILGL